MDVARSHHLYAWSPSDARWEPFDIRTVFSLAPGTETLLLRASLESPTYGIGGELIDVEDYQLVLRRSGDIRRAARKALGKHDAKDDANRDSADDAERDAKDAVKGETAIAAKGDAVEAAKGVAVDDGTTMVQEAVRAGPVTTVAQVIKSAARCKRAASSESPAKNGELPGDRDRAWH